MKINVRDIEAEQIVALNSALLKSQTETTNLRNMLSLVLGIAYAQNPELPYLNKLLDNLYKVGNNG